MLDDILRIHIVTENTVNILYILVIFEKKCISSTRGTLVNVGFRYTLVMNDPSSLSISSSKKGQRKITLYLHS